MTDYSGKERHVTYVIGHFGQPQANDRVLLGAHYDSRPWCHEEEEYENRFLAVPGANDGASGVGVLLEVARQIGLMASDSSKAAPNVDIVFFDCEDMGTPAFYTGAERTDTWCLGSQLWASEMSKNRQTRSRFQYGIVLDMVGAPDAVFPKEYHSMRWGGNYVEKIWRTANRLGHGRYFVQGECYPITDDHYYVNKIAGIPCVDVVNYSTTGTGFPSWWHTQCDDMSNISRETLQAVGETVMKVIGK
jgi:Zn-dependent M28 family amino/carboxypeptidase